MLTRVKISFTLGPIAGIGQVIMMFFAITLLWWFEIFFPEEGIDIAEDFNSQQYIANPDKFGNHLFNLNEPTAASDRTKTQKSYRNRSRFSLNCNEDDSRESQSSMSSFRVPRKTSLEN
jgi:hypothetical protein